MTTKVLVKNRKATHDFEVLEKYTAGLKLLGYEVRAIREGKANLDGSYVQVIDGVPYIVNMHIGRYSHQSQKFSEADASRSRQLLLNVSEILAVQRETQQKGKTAVPLALVLDHNLIKLEFAVVKGRKEFEKKHVAKEKQMEKDLRVEEKAVRQSESL